MINNILRAVWQIITRLFNKKEVREALKKLLWEVLYICAAIAVKKLKKLKNAT